MTKNNADIVARMKARHSLGPDASDSDYMQVFAALTPVFQDQVTAGSGSAGPTGKEKTDAQSVKP